MLCRLSESGFSVVFPGWAHAFAMLKFLLETNNAAEAEQKPAPQWWENLFEQQKKPTWLPAWTFLVFFQFSGDHSKDVLLDFCQLFLWFCENTVSTAWESDYRLLHDSICCLSVISKQEIKKKKNRFISETCLLKPTFHGFYLKWGPIPDKV